MNTNVTEQQQVCSFRSHQDKTTTTFHINIFIQT